jgi:hypothetical protein
MKLSSIRIVVMVCALLVLGAFGPPFASAQAAEGWQVDLAPLYLWAANTNGNLAITATETFPSTATHRG